MGKNVNPRKSLVAAALEKAITYVFAEMMIHNPKVGSSILPPATKSPTLSMIYSSRGA